MTPSDQPADQQLTRRQLREIRMTGATPIVTPEAAAEAAAQSVAVKTEPATPVDATPTIESPAETDVPAVTEIPAAPPLPLPRAAEPLAEAPAPAADATVDLGVRARTRRQARDQERIRTNSILVLTPEAGVPVVPAGEQPAEAAAVVAEATPVVAEPVTDVPVIAPVVPEAAPVVPEAAPVVPEAAPVVPEPIADAVQPVLATPVLDPEPAETASDESQWAPRAATGAAPIPISDPNRASQSIAASMATNSEPEEAKHMVRADFGAELLNQNESFDDLLVRSSTSSGSAGSASTLVLPEDVSMMPLTAPVTSTGQVILTGTFALPDGLGSQGHAPGVADGKDVDAVLIDGELAPQSSPTPIAATAAVSQAKTPVEMIRPPAPEKSSKLVVALAITAGLLSLAAIGFTIYVVTTGKFS